MSLTHAIAHYLQRPGSSADVRLKLRDNPYTPAGQHEDLLRRLKQAYVGKAGKAYGRFSSDAASFPFPRWLEEFHSGKLSFASFTQKTLQHFKLELENSEVVVDGHLLFMAEHLADSDLLYVFMIDHCEGLYIDSNLDMADVLYLDISKISLGAKINLTAWKEGESRNYLSVLRARGDKEMTELFWNLVGFTDQMDIAGDTQEFLDIVTDYTRTMPPDRADEYRAKVVEYCLEQDKSGTAVSIEALSQQVDEAAPEQFARFVAEKQETPKAELIPDRTQLRQFVRISGRDEQLSMSFSSACLGESIVYDQQTDSLMITKIPNSLKARLLKHMQKGG